MFFCQKKNRYEPVGKKRQSVVVSVSVLCAAARRAKRNGTFCCAEPPARLLIAVRAVRKVAKEAMYMSIAARRLGIGLIGYGPYGQHLARLVTNTTRAYVPLVWTRGDQTAAKIRSNGFDATADVDELINHPSVEAVI